MPSLSRTADGVDAVADRLLVGVDQGVAGQFGVGAGQPLEAGQRLDVAGAVVGGDRRQHPRGHHGAGHDTGGCDIGIELRQEVIAEQPTGFVAGEHPPSRVGGNADRAPVGVGVQRDRDVGVHLGGQRQQGVGGAGLLGVRETAPSGSRGRARTGLPRCAHRRSRPGAAPRRRPRRPHRAAVSARPAQRRVPQPDAPRRVPM